MRPLSLSLLVLSASSLFGEAQFVIVVADPPGIGFNDPTPAEPVGGNPGTTVGQQRLIVLQYAAGIWAGKLDSPVPIRIRANHESLECNAEGGYLASAGPKIVWAWPNPEPEFLANTWYPAALANRIAGSALVPEVEEIEATINPALGQPGCVSERPWYYGLDHRPPGRQMDMVTVLMHELAHGLGFAPLIQGVAGRSERNDVYSQYVFDTTAGKSWNEMTDAERRVSAGNLRRVVWSGANVRQAAAKVLLPGALILHITGPTSLAGDYPVSPATFGTPIDSHGASGRIVAAIDAADSSGPSTADACSPLVNASAVAGRIALVDRGSCPFVQKAWNVQSAGAIAMVIANNTDESLHTAGGTDSTIAIPVSLVTRRDGIAIRAALEALETVEGHLLRDNTMRSGTDRKGRPLLFTPYPIAGSSNIWHWDVDLKPSQLMEPIFEDDLIPTVESPDLVLPLLMDIGWLADFDGVPGGVDECPGSDRGETLRIQSCDTGVRNTTAPNGCRISDSFKVCSASRDGFLGCVDDVSNSLVRAGKLAPGDPAAIRACALNTQLP